MWMRGFVRVKRMVWVGDADEDAMSPAMEVGSATDSASDAKGLVWRARCDAMVRSGDDAVCFVFFLFSCDAME